MRRIGILGTIAAAAMAGMGPLVRGHHDVGSTRYSGHRPSRGRLMPHQGKREIARRLAQAARDEERQRARAELHPFYAAIMDTNRLSRRRRAVG